MAQHVAKPEAGLYTGAVKINLITFGRVLDVEDHVRVPDESSSTKVSSSGKDIGLDRQDYWQVPPYRL